MEETAALLSSAGSAIRHLTQNSSRLVRVVVMMIQSGLDVHVTDAVPESQAERRS